MAAPSAPAQWSAALWPATTTVARAVWTTPAGVSMTGSVKDARAAQAYYAMQERAIARNDASSTNAFAPKWYLWERANVVRFKTYASNSLPYFAARWLADGTDFTDYCAANNLTNVPAMTASNTIAHLGLPTNFWTFTPWVNLNRSSNGWDNIRRVIDLMTWTLAAENGGTSQIHTAINRWNDDESSYEYLYGNNYLEVPSWDTAKAHIGYSWAGMITSPNDDDFVYTAETNTLYPAASAFAPACWSYGSWSADASYTNWRAQAASHAYWPTGVAATNYERAADWYHAASGTVFDAYGTGVSTTAVRLVQVAAGNSATVTAASAIGEVGFPKTQPTWCAEPNSATTTTFRGYGTVAMQWVLRWDANTNGFKFVEE